MVKFEIILIISALLLASCSAFFSIVGIVGLFSNVAISVGIMAGSIELAKLCGTTFLYRYWDKITKIMRTYLLISIIILISITSMGIYGYLSSAYQISSSGFKNEQDKIVMVESQKNYLTNRIAQSKIRIDTLNNVRQLQESRLSSALTNDFLTRNPIQLRLLQEQTTDLIKSSDNNISSEQDKIQSISGEIEAIDNKILDIKASGNSKKDIKTFQFVADQLGVPLDTVARWFILIIVIIFDPLALVLLLSYNITVNSKTQSQPIINSIPTQQKPSPPFIEPVTQPIKEEVVVEDAIPSPTPPTPVEPGNSSVTPPITKLKL